jgi:hypothetical protein
MDDLFPKPGGADPGNAPAELILILPLWRKNKTPLGLLVMRKADPARFADHDDLPREADIPFMQLACTH